MKYITVSGIDRSGKTTLIKEYLERTKYQDYLVDRDPSNIFALNFIQNRWVRESFNWNEYRKFLVKHRTCIDLAVLLVCSPAELEKRFADSNEPSLVGEYSLEDHQKVIEDFFYGADYPNIIVIDTSKTDIETAVNIVVNKVEGMKNAN